MKIKTAVIGLGYWGPNFIRNFMLHNDTDITWGCDLEKNNLLKIKKQYPSVRLTLNYQDILHDKSVELVAIATPPETHFRLAKMFLEAGKHVIIAKPLATKATDVEKLINIAKKKKKLLHGDLTFIYTGSVRTIKKFVQKNSLGKLLYYDSTRTNLGLIQEKTNVIWDLAPHDFSILEYCFGYKPKKVFAVGSKHLNALTEEMAHITIMYDNGFIAHIHGSWLSPLKLRTIIIGGTKKMILYDDVEPHEKIKIYDKGISFSKDEITSFKPVYRTGNILIPKLDLEEALFLEIDDIIKQLRSGTFNYTNALMNLSTVKLLEACTKSLRLGKPIELN